MQPDIITHQITSLIEILTENLDQQDIHAQTSIGLSLDRIQSLIRKRLDGIRSNARQEAVTLRKGKPGVELVGVTTVTIPPTTIVILDGEVDGVRRMLGQQFEAVFEQTGKVRFRLRPNVSLDDVTFSQPEKKAQFIRSLQQIDETPQVSFNR